MLLQSIALYFYSSYNTNFSLIGAIETYLNLLDSEKEFSNQTKVFINDIGSYVGYCLLVAIGSALLGFGLHYLIRKTKADIRFKILRFRNHWYYVFSGEIKRFAKIKKAKQKLNHDHTMEHPNIMMSYADILVSNNGATKMYTGYVVDYELDTKDSNQLDKIYLIDVQKYNYIDKAQKNDSNDPDFIKKPIPGDLFIIDNSQVLNMNLTYIPSLHHKKAIEDKRRYQIYRVWPLIDILTILLFVSISIQLFSQYLKLDMVNGFIQHLNLFQKILFDIGLFVVFSWGFSNPYEKKKEKTTYKVLFILSIILIVGNCISIWISYK